MAIGLSAGLALSPALLGNWFPWWWQPAVRAAKTIKHRFLLIIREWECVWSVLDVASCNANQTPAAQFPGDTHHASIFIRARDRKNKLVSTLSECWHWSFSAAGVKTDCFGLLDCELHPKRVWKFGSSSKFPQSSYASKSLVFWCAFACFQIQLQLTLKRNFASSEQN